MSKCERKTVKEAKDLKAAKQKRWASKDSLAVAKEELYLQVRAFGTFQSPINPENQ